MSFSAEVKMELLRGSVQQPDCCAEAQLYGLLLFGREFCGRGMTLRTERREIAEYAVARLREIALAAARLTQAGRKWEVAVRGEDRLRVLERFGHGENEVSLRIVTENFSCEHCRTAFLRGVFLSCAAVTAPERHYHLEFMAGFRRLAGQLCDVLKEADLPAPKLCQRGGVWIAYYKDSSQIEDILAALGARLAMLDLVNIKIEKDMRNNVNRLVNFELANVDRSSAAAAAQLRAIRQLREKPGLEKLPPLLKEAALLREEYPEASLQELADMAAEPVTRSGMNHRLKKLVAMVTALCLFFSACGSAEAPTTTAHSTTEQTTITPQPLPANCRLLKGEASQAIEYFGDQIYWQRGDRTRLSNTIALFERSAEETNGAPQLLMRDETTGEETIIAMGMDSLSPTVQFIIDERYVVWTDNFKDNGYGGIYDTKRMLDISWGEYAFPFYLYDNTLWFLATAFHYGGPLSLFRVSLDGLDKADEIALGGNLLDTIPEAALDCRDLRSTALSADCRYFAVRGADIGIYIFDLQTKALAQQVPAGAIPGKSSRDPMPSLAFKDERTLYCYGSEPDVLEVLM